MATKAKKRGYLVTIPADTSKPISRAEFKGRAPELSALQAVVGGLIQPLKLKYEGRQRQGYVNEEGLLRGLRHNPRASEMWRKAYRFATPLVGDAVLILWETEAPAKPLGQSGPNTTDGAIAAQNAVAEATAPRATRARYIDGSHEQRKLLSNALVSLNRRISEGREFPNALESARLQWGLTDAEVTHLTAMYDAQDDTPPLPPLPPSVRDVDTVTEYGLTQKLSRAVRVF